MRLTSLLLVFSLLFSPILFAAEQGDSLLMFQEEYFEAIDVEEVLETPALPNPYRFRGTDLIAPSLMIGLGIAGLELKGLKSLNHDVSDAIWDNGKHKKLSFDNYTEYLPAVATYGLNLCGVRGLHDYVDLTIIMGTAYLMMAAIVYPTKDFVYSPRPDGSKFNSFPSGHAAWAFTGAEIMRREFWHVSPWIGVSGYLVAGGTAFMRLYNGAHWLTDVLAGAGIGILCAEAAYWLYPAISKHLFPKQYNSNIFISPTATPNSFGLGASIIF